MPLSVEILATLSLSIPEQVRFIQRAEEAGFDGAGTPDHPETGRDAFIPLALAAAQTSRIALFPGVTNPLTRHPLVLAGLAHSLNEVAPGRFKLVIGAGDASARQTGNPSATVERMRSSVTAIQRLLRGEAIPLGGGEETRLENIPSKPPPVVVAASGPRMLELAGEVGEEALVHVGLDPRMRAAAQRHLEAGARRAGRPPGSLRVTFHTLVSVDEDRQRAQERARGFLFGWLRQGIFAEGLKEVGLNVPPVHQPGEIPADALVRLCDLVAVVGSPEECAAKLQRLADDGVEHILCLPAGRGAALQRTLDAFEKVILPRVNRGFWGTFGKFPQSPSSLGMVWEPFSRRVPRIPYSAGAAMSRR